MKFSDIIKKMPFFVLLGVLGGVLGTLFHISLEYVTAVRESNSYIILFLPFGGLVIVGIYKLCRLYGNIDIKRVFDSVKGRCDVPAVMIPLIFAGTIITHFFGGSAGREGAALQLGGSLGYNAAKILKQNDDSKRIFVSAGMSAVFAALFGTPFTAAVFSLEVTGTLFNLSGIYAGILSSLSAFLTAYFLGVQPVRFEIGTNLSYNTDVFFKVAVFAILCACICVVFALSLNFMKKFMKKIIKNSYMRVFAGGALVVLLTVVLDTTDYNGAGMDIITSAMNGKAYGLAFLLKIIFTAITMSAGFKGGEIVPTFFIGATFGCFAGTVLGIDAGICAALGLVALFSGMTKCPVAAFLLALEVFSGKLLVFFVIAELISYKFSGKFGLYDNSKKVF